MSLQLNTRRLRATGAGAAFVFPLTFILVAVAISAAFPAAASTRAPHTRRMRIIQATQHDTSQPLRIMRKHMSSMMQTLNENRRLLEELHKERIVPIGRKRPTPGAPFVVRDSRVQGRVMASAPAFDYVANFDGIENVAVGFGEYRLPPDPDLTVGENYVLAQVNSRFAIYDKQGNTIMPPTDTNSLWQGFGGPCELQNDGDGIVLYDRMAHRWVVSQFTSGNAPFYECVAVSVTNDPTGRYYRYAFETGDTVFPDYPKLGVWPDAYYASFNDFRLDGSKSVGVALAAFDRGAMLAGRPAEEVLFRLDSSQLGAWGALPAELDGPTPPPDGAPGYFVSYVSPNQSGTNYYALEMREMHVDWQTPAASTLSGPEGIQVPPFNDTVCGDRSEFGISCIPQPNGAPGLDSLSDRLMFRLAYRNLGTHEAMVVNQTVSVGVNDQPPAGIRWYELTTSTPGANDWSLAQSGTWAPADGASRWMGSIAMDHDGDMMLGYSLSGPNTAPSIAFTGRLAGDPSDQMTLPEQIIQAGGGEQSSNSHRWGDYSSLVVDPADDCTLWYVNEYYPQTSAAKYHTRIGAMKFSACSGISEGTLSGTVDSADGSPIAGAHVMIEPGDIVTKTDKNGKYRIELDSGSYTVSALAYAYIQSAGVAVDVSSGATTTQDIALKSAPMVSLSGVVCDGGRAAAGGWKCGDAPTSEVHGWGMYARVQIQTPGFGDVADVWTAPATGAYHVMLAKGLPYTVTATASDRSYYGYAPASAALTATGAAKLDFALGFVNDFVNCGHPGYQAGYDGSCTKLPGGLVVGEVIDANTGDGAFATVTDDLGNFDSTCPFGLTYCPDINDPALKDLYMIFTDAGQRTLTATNTLKTKEVDSKAEVKADDAVRDDMAFGTADLAVSDVSGGQLDQGGSSKIVQITLINNGPDTSARASLTTSAPASIVKTVSAESTQGSCETNADNGVDCALGDIAPGASVKVTLDLFGLYAGQGKVTAQASEIDTDPDPGNNSGSAQVTVASPPSPGGGGSSGGGGSFGWPALAALLAFAALRRRHAGR